jgi:MFS family permease
MTLGCLFIAPIGDRIGRKKIFIYSFLLICAGLYGVALLNDYALILISRFLTGLGIGGILPTLTSTASEYANDKRRDFLVGFIQAGWPIGAILTGLVAAAILPNLGWQIAFLIAALFSTFILILILIYFENSIEFSLLNPHLVDVSKFNLQLKRMDLDPVVEIPAVKRVSQKIGLKDLLSPEERINTLKLWIAAFFGFITLYTLMSWVPKIAEENGLAFQLATYVGITLNIGAAIGSSSIGAIGYKFGLKRVQLIFMLLGFAVMQYFSQASLNTFLIFLLIFLGGIFVQGGFNGIWPILSRVYASEKRNTGIGFTVGFGRFGAVFGPMIFGYLRDQDWSSQTLFMIFSLPLLLMGGFIYSLKSKNL